MNFRIGNLFREISYSLRRSPSLFIGTLGTILISLTFVGGGLIVREAVNSATERWRDGVEFIVFMSPDATGAEIDSVNNKLLANPEVDRFTFVNQQAALEEFEDMFRDSEQIRDSVSVEDLPPSYRIVPQNPESAVVEALADGFVTIRAYSRSWPPSTRFKTSRNSPTI